MKTKKKLRILLLILVMTLSPLFVLAADAVSCPLCGGKMKKETSAGTTAPPTCTQPGSYFYICTSCRYSYSVRAGALGHNYVKKVLKNPTCTAKGKAEYTCSRCGDHYTDTLAALGHKYEIETTEPTCTEDGTILHSCVRCSSTYEEPIPALGHSFEVTEDTAPTCTETGVHTETCSTCGEAETVYTEPTGHSFTYLLTPAECTEDGSRVASCSVCGETETEILPAHGHLFGEWTVSEEPGLYREGERERHCQVCGETEREALPPMDPGGRITATVGGLLTLFGLGTAAWLKWIPEMRISRRAAAIVKAAGGKPSLRMRKIILCLDAGADSAALEKCLKRKMFLNVQKPGEPAPETPEPSDPETEKQPELASTVLFNASSPAELESRLAELKQEYPNSEFSVVAGDSFPEELLKELTEKEEIFSYAFAGDKTSRKFFRLIGPMYKPDEISDEYAANATLITAALGFPVLTVILNSYVVGSDLKDAAEYRGMTRADTADLISDAAALFGLDALADAADRFRKGFEKGGRLINKKKMKDLEKADPASEE